MLNFIRLFKIRLFVNLFPSSSPYSFSILVYIGIYPVVIFNRGGNRTFAELTVATMIMYTSKLAEQGYVIIGSNYRENDEFGGEEINDVLNLIETVKEIKKVDAECIGMFGWSRGGIMTYLALQKSTRITSAIIGNAPTDLFGSIADRPEMETKVLEECIPNYAANKDAELKKRSAIFWPEQLYKHTSLLILSGTNDDRVNPNQVEKLSVKLKELGHDFQLIRYETDHFFTDKKVELNQTIIGWFNRELKGKKI